MKDRTIQRLVAEGRLVHKRELDPATKQVALYIDEASIDALARPAPLAVVQPAGAETSLTAPMTLEMLKKLERVEEEIEQRIKELSGLHKEREPMPLWLTIDQAARVSGLPADFLKQKIKDGSLSPLDVGKGRRGGRWRLRKDDLGSI